MSRRTCERGWPVATGLLLLALVGCESAPEPGGEPVEGERAERSEIDKYTTVRLTADLSGLSENQRRMIGSLIEAGRAMDEAFWLQAYGDRRQLLDSIADPDLRRFAEINYGPWDRLDANRPFVDGVGAKPAGANFYPADMTREELETAATAAADGGAALRSLYTIVERDESGSLTAVPYSRAFAEQVGRAAAKLREAAALAEDPGFRRYLELRAEALLTDDYRASDLAWMEMKDNVVDVVIGPIETYEDQLLGYKAAFETFVLLKDQRWSERLSRYAALLPDLQRGLPVADRYKSEMPGSDADLNAYDALYYAGDCNAGSKTIAINLPNDEQVQLSRGTRRLQLKNAMRAKFDEILLPISGLLIAEDQRPHVTFDAFFANTMFHEVAHGLGIKNTLDGSSTVRAALRDHASTLEEGKADILGLYMVSELHERGELGAEPLEDYYVTFLAGIFRSVRFGASNAHGRANMIRFNYFSEQGAFSRAADGTYRADFERMREAIDSLSELLLTLQGDGDYDAAASLVASHGVVGDELQADLARLSRAGIATDIVFEQGSQLLGLD
ncbi:MAG TPA: hypothetical protein VD788_06210 [Candidatus Polarisedimenticolaceae bacterium]|nr:hypothetical protein [Candidatus Polarisedimenticolaceae bacterium]